MPKETIKRDKLITPDMGKYINASTTCLKTFSDKNEKKESNSKCIIPVALKSNAFIRKKLSKELKTAKVSNHSRKVIDVNHNYKNNINITYAVQSESDKPGEATKSKNLKKDKSKKLKLTKKTLEMVLKKSFDVRIINELIQKKESRKEKQDPLTLLTEDSLFEKDTQKQAVKNRNSSKSVKKSERSEKVTKDTEVDKYGFLNFSNYEG